MSKTNNYKICDLRITDSCAANISRVGIDQFEWLRMKSQDN